jgi:hypothetical protein
MQPRTGTWSFDEHTTSTWVPAQVGMPSPSSGPSAHTGPERDESAIWDDPDEATRKLSSQDLARTLDSATDLEMDWDEDESRTHEYSPEHARAILQMTPLSPRANTAPRPQSTVRQRAVRPEELEPFVQRPADPATAGALASIQQEAQQPEARPRRATPTASVAAGRAVPRAGSARANAPQLRPKPSVPARPLSRPRTLPLQAQAQFDAPRSAAPNATGAAAQEPRTAPLWSAGGALLPVTHLQPPAAPPRPPALDRAPGSSPPSVVRAVSPPPIPATAPTGNERAWTQAWEDAQALARTHLHGNARAFDASAPPEQHAPMRRQPPPQPHYDGPTYRNFPPHPAEANAYADGAVLPPMAAIHQLRAAAHSAVAPLPFEAEELEFSQPHPAREIKRLAVWSAIPGLALFGAVLMGRVLLAGPAPEPVSAPSAVVAPVEAAPAALPEPAQAPSAVAPASVDRRASARTRDASRTRARASHDDVATDDSADSASDSSSQRTTRSPRAAAETSAADESAATPVERTSGIGILRLNSRPWSQVSVDGKVVGNTPQMGLRLRAGSHQIELVNSQLGMSKKFKVEIQADEIVTRSEMLEE